MDLQVHSPLRSDDSDDSDGTPGSGLSLDGSAQPAVLTVKTESCDGLSEGKNLNGVLLQAKGSKPPPFTNKRSKITWFSI